ncbi:MAG: hypothetical protein RBU45_20230 [Myxococcota bacterium]|jgi:hypothetical protein|nr:hypothetical protein [Myxococcota bacterium]
MAKVTKPTASVAIEGAPSTCPKDSKKMVATKIVRHEGRSGMYWVCECGYMAPLR